MSSSNSSSKVWEYFVKLSKDRAVCAICPIESCKDFSIKRGSTSGLINHLRNWHPDKHAEFLERTYQSKYHEYKAVEMKMPNMTMRNKLKFDSLVLKLMIENDLEFTFVEGETFRQLVSLLNPTYEVKGPEYYSLEKLEEAFKACELAVRDKMTNTIKEGQNVSISFNTWTSNDNELYLTKSIHYVDEEFCELTNLVFEVSKFNDTLETSELVNSIDEAILKIPNLCNIKSLTAVLNNTPNIAKACNLSQYIKGTSDGSVTCAATNLKKSLLKAIEKTPEVDCVFSRITKLAKKISIAPKLEILLKHLCIQMNLNYIPLSRINFNDDEFNETTIRSLITMETPILELANSPKFSSFSLPEEDFKFLRIAIPALTAFKNITKSLSMYNVSSIDHVHPKVQLLVNVIEKLREKSASELRVEFQHFFTELIQYLELKFFKDPSLLSLYTTCAFLNPAYKDKLLETEQRDRVLHLLKSLQVDDLQSNYQKNVDEDVDENFSGDEFERECKRMKVRLSNPIQDAKPSLDNEIDFYLRKEPSSNAIDALTFWRENRATYPIMSKIACQLLGMPATSSFGQHIGIGENVLRRFRGEYDMGKIAFIKSNIDLMWFADGTE